ncbi:MULTISPECIES: deoxyadenosine/deoxycytidine kinase [Bacillus]|jgi:deoxyadenosine/deoxycytidine kinase|uniref:Deoxyadenosine/deoxycytidine kinase n=1 Tax=Bacillus amyloliquefaciens (strain ATCC 23350 / DSM 7 / BCRC 11601 / CCUG 28519 / NBRC 15535 / NRRL B-14393 / F) TaxID=692420 RepID=A0A9P1JED1_BACAS|nr:deoxyadenosine/deoxycytidine kinase [Bacillus amyloliquefaciens]AIW32133.1 deoxycytidine kinase [Bacillus subtilis]HBO5952076.1 deoxynucleoside kinase [Pseudomonas aeruginosa]AEB22206.1 deoxyadenosine/deoxycytidine kinase [Bacillus amyloliquefaciens TA208]AEB61570.1 deoxyadenosine/deoxycytidine kinase [Bacillus amyloliquefaciens LL3]AEK87170.1 deoxyadenosine/deoxycytidine kinase [Bacillus amyloliquefaciens XH7]
MKDIHIPNNAIITVAGTVGVGKSTLTKALAKRLGFNTSLEEVDENPYLEKFYHDFERWSFHLQIYFLAERFKEQKNMFESGGGFVQDRSIYEDTGIFAKMHADKGTMSLTDYKTYTSLFEAMVMTPYFPHPDVLIYLEGDLENIIERIEKRGREMELQTNRAYWEEMYTRYEDWISGFNACPVLKVRIEDYDLEADEQSLEPLIEKISHVINENRKK